jgi:hypothetical protein
VQVGRLLALLNGRSAGEIVKSLRLMIKTHAMDAARANPVERAASYLVKNMRLLHYDRALADGLTLLGTERLRVACPHARRR